MKQEKTFRWKSKHWLMAGALLLSCGLGMTSCDKYDLDKTAPDNLGGSIYEYMSTGNFKTMTRMVDDLGYQRVLNQTGSKTLFLADDAAFDRFYKSNPWGVKRYEDFSVAQKKMLLNGAMINNTYQIMALSSIGGQDGVIVEGDAMRRFSSATVYDSVPVIKAEQMPQNRYWDRYREQGSITCMRDMTVAPMIHFIEPQLRNKLITNDDVDFLFNYKTQRHAGDASVNGCNIIEPNIRCLNGFIHRVDEVMMPLPNMADVIGTKPEASIYYSLLERFTAPYYCGDEVTRNYNTQQLEMGLPTVDSLFQKRYFSDKSQGQSQPLAIGNNKFTVAKIVRTPDLGDIPGSLKYDPGWNSYISSLGASLKEEDLQRDMGVMLVPTNKAMTDYLKGEGYMLAERYGSWENFPHDVVVRLINNNMLESFLSSVPSKFATSVFNDANDPMGITTADVDSVWLACNGAVYLTNKVFPPTAFISVLYPTVVNETMKIIEWAVKQTQYEHYLNSLNSTYGFFIPTHNAMLEYVDPVSYGKTYTYLYRFHYDYDAKNVWASSFKCDPKTMEIIDDKDSTIITDTYTLRNRLKDVLDTHIVIGGLNDNLSDAYYITKGGMGIRVRNAQLGDNGMTVEGSYQVDKGESIPVTRVYPQRNGKAYAIEAGPILGTRKNVDAILKEHEEFTKFDSLLVSCGLLEQTHYGQACSGENVSLFNTYHYTVYVPTNESIEALQKAGKLPWTSAMDAVEDAKNKGIEGPALADIQKKQSADSLLLANFVKYHIQDNSVFLKGVDYTFSENEWHSGIPFETGYLNEDTKGFERLTVKRTDSSIEVKDRAGNVRKVIIDGRNLYNLQAREYIYDSGDATRANNITTSSAAVIHYIDGPLLYSK